MILSQSVVHEYREEIFSWEGYQGSDFSCKKFPFPPAMPYDKFCSVPYLQYDMKWIRQSNWSIVYYRVNYIDYELHRKQIKVPAALERMTSLYD